MAFSADGKTLATSSDYPATVKLWDVATGKEKMELGVFAWSLAFSPDGKTQATTLDSVILWDVTTGKKRATFPKTNSIITCVGFTPDGKTLASVTCTRGLDNDKATGKLPLGTLKLWDVATTKERASSAIPVFPGMSFFSLAFTADSKTLISAMWFVGETPKYMGLAVQHWEVATGKARATHWTPFNAGSNNAGVQFTALSADGKTVAWGGVEEKDKKITGTAHVCEVGSLATSVPKLPKEPEKPAQEPKFTLTGHTKPVTSVAFSPDSTKDASINIPRRGVGHEDSLRQAQPRSGETLGSMRTWTTLGSAVAKASRRAAARSPGFSTPRHGNP